MRNTRYYPAMGERLPTVTFKADEETARILDVLTEAEGRSRSDVIRRALRLYGERAGLVERQGKPKAVKVNSSGPRPRRAKR